jgi:glycosyltransferase involved in cell wall biosynthesis
MVGSAMAPPGLCCLTVYVGPPRGGCHARLQRLVGALLDRGWTVHFVGTRAPAVGGDGLRFHAVRGGDDASPSLATLARAAWRAARVSRRERIPLVWTFGAVYSAALAPLLRPRAPRLVTFLRGSLAEQQRARGSGPLRRLAARAAERVAIAASDVVVGVSHALARPAGGKGRVLPNEASTGAAAEERDVARRALGLPAQAFVAGYAGAMTPLKSLETLLAAAAMVPGLHVALLGFSSSPSTYERALRAAAAPLGGRAHLLDWRPDSGALIGAADVVVLPSRDEGCPNLLLEAMDAHRPCLGARCAGIAEVLAEDALLFPVGDAAALAARLRAWMEDEDARRHASRLCAARAEAFRFDWDERATGVLRDALAAEGR